MFPANRAGDFQERRDSDTVVSRAGAGDDRIVMRAEHQHVRAWIAGKRREDVRDVGAGRVSVAGESLLQRRLISELAELRDHAIANDVVSGRPDRMRRPVAQNRSE